MSVVINGTAGISGVNGSAATPAIQGGDADTGIFFGTDTASISTGGLSRLVVDSDGTLRIATGSGWASPAAGLQLAMNSNDAFVTTYFDAHSVTLGAGTSYKNRIRVSGTSADNNITFNVGASASNEKMRLLSSGELLIGGHTTPRNDVLVFNNTTSVTPKIQIETAERSYNNGLSVVNNGDQGHGSIVTIGTTSSTTPGGSALGSRSTGWQMGHLQFAAGEGNNLKAGARLSAYTATSNVSDDRVPTYLTLSNSRDSQDAPIERLRLDERGTFINKYATGAADSADLGGHVMGRHSYGYLTERAPGNDGDTRFYRLEIGNTYSGGGHPQILRLNVAFATYHASGMGNCEALINMRHGSDRLLITKFRKISEVSIGGWFYGMGTPFQLRVFGSTLDDDDAGLILRVQGRTGNGSTYDGNAHIHIACEALGGVSSYCLAPKIIPLGTSAPSDLDSEVTAQNLTWS